MTALLTATEFRRELERRDVAHEFRGSSSLMTVG